jgi:hypothetical protein
MHEDVMYALEMGKKAAIRAFFWGIATGIGLTVGLHWCYVHIKIQ